MLLRPTARRSWTADRARGQALVEFALVFPLFVLLLFGLVDLGRLAYINNAIAEAAREGARWGTVQGRSISAADRTNIAAKTKTLMAAVPNPTVTVTCEDVHGTARSTCTKDNILVVRVDTTVSMLTPVIGQLVGPRTFTAISRMVVNN
jgi:Flp pilus assembly protein TadG